MNAGQPMKWAEVDYKAIESNVRAIKEHVGEKVAVMAMVKAGGYGHGAVGTSHAAVRGGATWLGVSSAEEALELTHAGIEARILNVGWTHPSQFHQLLDAGVHLTVYAKETIEALARAAAGSGVRAAVHLKIDTGMGRLGARPESLPALLETLREHHRHVELAGIFTHFADADGVDVAFTDVQHSRFVELAAEFKEHFPAVLLHCANSAATLRMPEMHHDIVRPGIAIYGYPPPNTDFPGLRRAMTFKACITLVKTVEPGDTVGYGRTWKAEKPTRVATVAAGYADGVYRAQSNHGSALVQGKRVPIIGRISMDQTTLDVSNVEGVNIGDEAVFFGQQVGAALGADEVAKVINTISYEVLCAVSARVPRIEAPAV